jgi:DNA modification methylase
MRMTKEKEYPNGKLLIGDVMDRIRDIPDKSVDCVISSPPYWGLRDYGVSDQWGSEPTYQIYLDRLRNLMDEIKRVLKDTGTCWINLGDSYGSHRSNEESIKIGYEKQEMNPIKGLEKSRVGVPERFYIMCIDDGWIARNHIVWAKSNAMPTSVKDRFQNKWESVFFFAKKKKYFFNLDAVREKPISDYKNFNRRVRDAKKYKEMGLGDFSPTLAKASEKELAEANKDGVRGNQQPNGRSNFGTGKDIHENMKRKWEKDMGQSTQTIAKNHSGNFDQEGNLIGNPKGKNPGDVWRKQADVPGQTEQGIHRNREQGKPDWYIPEEEWDYSKIYKSHENTPQGNKSIKARMAASRAAGANHDGCLNDPKGKNPGDIFHINPRPFVEAHFATFPPELPEKIIKCAVPEGGVVLDPFMGSGTVAYVAASLNRKWVGIELNEEYAKILDKRMKPRMNVSLDGFS